MHTIGISSNDPTVVIQQARDLTDSRVTSIGKQIWRVINELCFAPKNKKKRGLFSLSCQVWNCKASNIRPLTSDRECETSIAGSLTWDGESPICLIFMIQDREELRLRQEAVK